MHAISDRCGSKPPRRNQETRRHQRRFSRYLTHSVLHAAGRPTFILSAYLEQPAHFVRQGLAPSTRRLHVNCHEPENAGLRPPMTWPSVDRVHWTGTSAWSLLSTNVPDTVEGECRECSLGDSQPTIGPGPNAASFVASNTPAKRQRRSREVLLGCQPPCPPCLPTTARPETPRSNPCF